MQVNYEYGLTQPAYEFITSDNRIFKPHFLESDSPDIRTGKPTTFCYLIKKDEGMEMN